MIKYKKRRKYKYNLHSSCSYSTGITIKHNYDSRFLVMTEAGELTIHFGYSWDGPSGPTIDTKSFMRGSLIHDALYQLMREEVIDDRKKNRKIADQILVKICIEDGMCRFRAKYVYWAVRLFSRYSAKPDMKIAPRFNYR